MQSSRGGDGKDSIYPGFGVDNVYGNAGDDYFETKDCAFYYCFPDYVDGGDGTDRASLRDGSDNLVSIEK